MKKSNKVIMNPVPDIHTHEFTIYALNELYENQFVFDRRIKKVRRGNNIKFVLLTAAIGYILDKVKKIEALLKE